jgi:hypothetical protein
MIHDSINCIIIISFKWFAVVLTSSPSILNKELVPQPFGSSQMNLKVYVFQDDLFLSDIDASSCQWGYCV